MLVKITTKCSRGCSHCLDDCKSEGEHMSMATWKHVLRWVNTYEPLPHILVSGGEPTEHPQLLAFLSAAKTAQIPTMLLTNGILLHSVLYTGRGSGPRLVNVVQVTDDPRFYPEPRVFPEDPTVVREIRILFPLGRGRAAISKHPELDIGRAPHCFNLRSLVHGKGGLPHDFRSALRFIRMRAMAGSSGSCRPAICADGSIVGGESRFCGKYGTIDDSNEQLTQNILEFKCNRCGLEDRLGDEHREAIGLPRRADETVPVPVST